MANLNPANYTGFAGELAALAAGNTGDEILQALCDAFYVFGLSGTAVDTQIKGVLQACRPAMVATSLGVAPPIDLALSDP